MTSIRGIKRACAGGFKERIINYQQHLMQTTSGIDHVGLAVKDVSASAAFFIDVLGFKNIGGKPEYPAIFVDDGNIRITLWQIETPDSAPSPDRRKNIGLHHLALKLDSFEKLDSLYKKLLTIPSIRIEFAPEQIGDGPSMHMMMYEPGGIRLEFIARA